MASMMARLSAGVFPPRRPGQTDGDLRKELNERKAPRDSTILTRTELDIVRDMIAGKMVMSLPLQSVMRLRTAAAIEHKQLMQEYDAQHRQNGVEDKTLEDIEEEQQQRLHLERAKNLIDNQFEEVRAMNQVVMEAKCLAIRNAQLLEKKRHKEEQRKQEDELEKMMVLESNKAQRIYEERERQQKEGRMKNLAVIRAQLDERDIDRIQKLEAHQQEKEAMTRHIEQLREEEAAEKLRRQEAARRLMEDAALSNAEQIKLKKRQQELELAEDKRVAEYIKEKEERERRFAEKQQRIREEKEREIARVRAQQQRVQDKQAELDEIRAKRAQEAHARETQRKEKERKEHERAILQDLAHVREQQMEERKRIKAQQHQQELEELEHIVAIQKLALEKDQERKARAQQLHEENSLAVLKQIMEVEERRRHERQEHVAEGNQILMQMRDREAAIEAIRQRKLAELEELGVPEEYSKALMKKIRVRGAM
ncbi:flagella associated protein [Trypanosoma rangeli]|uniref:Cilia- and flagella-associated protein 45 n=1 Tax=Trypanosoma rangeli TaxID=5698 RepID=A0A422NGP1_TRYRA|nr:flagella associated protein [Trypanosoma rangeli]RNF04616.1 flagella associated protein [Trypanosoma rangeli]|eukprot:RNF04616.1 flagella associated protein [Trypanosoma rangeli]